MGHVIISAHGSQCRNLTDLTTLTIQYSTLEYTLKIETLFDATMELEQNKQIPVKFNITVSGPLNDCVILVMVEKQVTEATIGLFNQMAYSIGDYTTFNVDIYRNE